MTRHPAVSCAIGNVGEEQFQGEGKVAGLHVQEEAAVRCPGEGFLQAARGSRDLAAPSDSTELGGSNLDRALKGTRARKGMQEVQDRI